MSVTSQIPYKKYTAAPGATLFSTGFRLILATDLVVKVNGSVVSSGFTVSSLGAGAGSDVTFGVPMVGGEIVELVRSVPKTRTLDYQQLGDYQAAQVNKDFDRIVMMLQDAQFLNDLAVLLPIGDTAAPMTFPTVLERALRFLAFDALGNAVAAAGVTGSPVSSFMAAVMLAADQAAARAAIGAQVAGSYEPTLGYTAANDAAVAKLTGNQTIAGTKTFTSQPVVPAQSYVAVDTFNLYGSTNTRICRFTNLRITQGTDITYADSATLGATFTINTPGTYAISWNQNAGGASDFGLSLNSAQLTTGIAAITAANRIAMASTPGANVTTQVTITRPFVATDVIRPHGDGTGLSGNPERANFTITRVA